MSRDVKSSRICAKDFLRSNDEARGRTLPCVAQKDVKNLVIGTQQLRIRGTFKIEPARYWLEGTTHA